MKFFDQLADKLGVSKRTVYRIVNDMREMGLPIDYSLDSGNYFYAGDVIVRIEISRVDKEKVKGGEKFFSVVTDFGTEDRYFSTS
jgi:hypothetical protein